MPYKVTFIVSTDQSLDIFGGHYELTILVNDSGGSGNEDGAVDISRGVDKFHSDSTYHDSGMATEAMLMLAKTTGLLLRAE